MTMTVSLSTQIGELSRMIDDCEREFGVAVGRGKMSAAVAEYRLDCLRAGLKTLLCVLEFEDKIKAARS